MQHNQGRDKKRQANKVNPRRMKLLSILFLCFVSWACVALFGQVDQLREKKQSLLILEDQLKDAQAENEAFKHQIIRLNDSEYIEQRVRQEFHYTKPGDMMFVPDSSER